MWVRTEHLGNIFYSHILICSTYAMYDDLLTAVKKRLSRLKGTHPIPILYARLIYYIGRGDCPIRILWFRRHWIKV